MTPTSLTISDSSNIGCQLDIQCFQRHTSFGFTCFTAVQQHSSKGAYLLTPVSIEEQIKTVLIGGPVKSTKIGRIYTPDQLNLVTDYLLTGELGTIVVDLPLLSEHISSAERKKFLSNIDSLPVILCGGTRYESGSDFPKITAHYFKEVTQPEKSSPLSAAITALSSKGIKDTLLIETIKKSIAI